MAFSAILSRFREHSPLPVMARALLERALTEEKLEACFENATEKQYTRELLFSSIFELMSLVVTQTFSSINAAYQARRETIGVSITSVYNKLNGLETSVSAALVRDSAMELGGMIHALKATCSPLLPGYRVKMVDGNCLKTSEHRLKALRDQSAAALPGKSLVVYDPALEVAVEVFPCEDGYAQERSLLPKVLGVVEHDEFSVSLACERISSDKQFAGLSDFFGEPALRLFRRFCLPQPECGNSLDASRTQCISQSHITLPSSRGRPQLDIPYNIYILKTICGRSTSIGRR
ncbi:hypothetical protein [Nitrosococcus wardiae]|uniref:Uncharacterized protein n=1 Tax=Nitrosococcus wardiae TaxID=1814290 RepID=A0A4P7BZW5_9GAMM|nr:hypothetical protein [Nitrosococcus wardiae]QBQ54780.1 hypothetical protein E3U44_09880 [Nitrosococcus wardiae]